ncbi:MAG: CDP-2,3-bis-(O-geranylgeranyl)-sn-glycerol synthase [Candidatus Aenigmarchaeota archaeon]|nr:CDP-2,3-bis-(O-geranylgeranyl)-sn-glycerol synthase [Candidatus Aenigmarchaeota archaeon]
MDFLLFVVNIFWFIASSYVANGFPPVMKGKKPIDFGRNLRNHRILGNSKTIEGTIGGIIAGLAVGSLQVLYQDMIPLQLYHMTFPLIIALVLGTMAGDIAGSFIKRRFGLNSGDSAVIMDQLGFLVAAFLFASVVETLDPYILIALLLATPPIHLFTNYIGCYMMKVKKNPW